MLPVSEHIDCQNMIEDFNEEDDEESNGENDLSKLFILENLSHKGYKDDILDLEGLDYEHSIMAICYLAKGVFQKSFDSNSCSILKLLKY